MKIIRVKWRDSHNYSGWTRPSEIEGGYKVDICESVGGLISKSDDCLAIALHTDINGNYGHVAVIPNEAILEYEVIRE